LATTALSDWLARLEQRSPESRIELGLERVDRVRKRLKIDPRPAMVATIAGTNGKGSVVAYLEQMALAAGHRTFAYSSPHLIDFSERMRINGQPASSAAIVRALDAVERAREDEFLTYFEQITLAAFVLASQEAVDLWVLEVGLGGRLDAVNCIDPDVAVITSIGLDHTEWLGSTRLAIGREKAGIARSGRPLVVGETRLPDGLLGSLENTGAELFLAGRDFRWCQHGNQADWRWESWHLELPEPGMSGRWQKANAAVAVMAARLLNDRLEMPEEAIRVGIVAARVPGRLQVMGSRPTVLVDVAHNPAAARALAAELGSTGEKPSVAVFSALDGKDVAGIGRALKHCFSHWLVAPLSGSRGRSADDLAASLRHAAVTGRVDTLESVADALGQALELAGCDGRVVVFGSFRTVAEAWPLLQTLR